MTKKTEFTNSKGVIDEKKFLKILGFNKPSPRVKTVSTPVGQITTLSPAGKDLEELAKVLVLQAEQMKKYSLKLYYIFMLLYNSGCRISEILAINPIDIMVNGNVRIKGKKGSNNRVIFSAEAKDYLLFCKKNSVVPFKELDRKFCYRSFKKFGIQIEVSSSGKKAVTHALRHLNISMAKQVNMNLEERAEYIGHKNKANTKNYGNIKKQ